MKDYKAIWNGLSTNYDDATLHVCSVGEEEEIRRRGTLTADFLKSILQITREDKVLEIGCGVARVGRELASVCGEWHGTDISGNMLVFASKRLEGIPNAYLHELPTSTLSIFPDNSFDCVYSTIVFMHLDKSEMYRYMCEAYRVLVPGGRAYFDTCNILSPESWRQFMVLLNTYGPGERPGHAAQYSTPQEMEKFLQEAGFEQIHVNGDNPQLVVGLGRKAEQPDYVRGVIDHTPFALKSSDQDNGASNGSTANIAGSHQDHQITGLRDDARAKEAYIEKLEQTLAEKEQYITQLERKTSEYERYLSSPMGRLAVRLSRT